MIDNTVIILVKNASHLAFQLSIVCWTGIISHTVVHFN